MPTPCYHERTTYVYGLCDERGFLRYVGKTNDPQKRLRKHLREARLNPKCHRECWLKGMQDRGLKPELCIIEEVPESEWQDAERFWIQYFRFIGCDLLNLTSGGDGCPDLAPESRARMAKKVGDAHRGRPLSEEHRRKIGEAQKGKVISPETRAAVSKANRGRVYTDEQRQSRSERQTGRKMPPRSEEWRRKKSEAERGKVLSPETRAKLSAAKKGVPKTPEHRAKIGEANRGRPVSEASREKSRQAHLGKTHTDEARRKMSRPFLVTPPDGEEFLAYNLTEFCAEHGLNRSSCWRVLKGIIPDIHGWKFRPSS
jgi:GIY-YIG catalytic domain/NUMOD3 motif